MRITKTTKVTDFNPHSRKGSDDSLLAYFGIEQISIHTPARGVTHTVKLRNQNHMISIHTPARGVTLEVWRNSWTPGISIHTPARGVTYLAIRKQCIADYFNPHSRKGSDDYFFVWGITVCYFNPHSRKGSDGAL